MRHACRFVENKLLIFLSKDFFEGADMDIEVKVEYKEIISEMMQLT